jgi:hypothetical protein
MVTIADELIKRELAETLSDTALLAMARKAKESIHPGERELFAKHLRDRGHDPDEIIARGARQSTRTPRPSATGADSWHRSPEWHRAWDDARSSRGRSSRARSRDWDFTGKTTPKWAWAGHAGGIPPSHDIYEKSYKDINYIKKRMYELSAGKRRAEHYVQQFDGSYFRNSFMTYGHESIHPEMAKAMLQWGSSGNPYHTKAIFASRRNNPREMHLLWANGRHMPAGTIYKHTGRNKYAHNDPQAREAINAFIDKHAPVG